MTSAYRAACAPVGVFDAFAFEPNSETISNARSPPIVIIRAKRATVHAGVAPVSVSVFRPKRVFFPSLDVLSLDVPFADPIRRPPFCRSLRAL